MGIFSSIKKSSAIKRITKTYLSDPLVSDNSAVAREILDFLSSNDPFKGFMRTDNNFKKVDITLILKIIKEFESYGYGPPHITAGHSPVISSFFFLDILYFLIIAESSQKNYQQLLYDIDEYFRNGEIVFAPTIDPRQ
jgi:hypothetical protein